MNKRQAGEIYARLAAGNPEPVGDLEWTNPFTLLVAVALSAQATDSGVNRATRKLFKVAQSPRDMLALGEEGVRDLIRTIGLFNTKAKNLIRMAAILEQEYCGDVPRDRDALERLPGVGRKTANVVLNTAFGQPTIAVDTHVFRVANRTGLAPGKTPLAVEKALERVTPEAFRLHAHLWLILHGRYTCKSRSPECWRCPIVEFCRYKMKDLAGPRPSSDRVVGRGR